MAQSTQHTVTDKEGHPIAIKGTVTDITERKQAEEALKKRVRLNFITRIKNF